MRKWFLAAGLTVLLLPTAALPQQKSGKGSVYEQLNLFSEAFERIRGFARAHNRLLSETARQIIDGSLDVETLTASGRTPSRPKP